MILDDAFSLLLIYLSLETLLFPFLIIKLSNQWYSEKGGIERYKSDDWLFYNVII